MAFCQEKHAGRVVGAACQSVEDALRYITNGKHQQKMKGSVTMKHYAVTEKSIKAWTKAYENSTERQLATMELARCDLKDVEVVSKAAGKMRYKFSVDIKTLEALLKKDGYGNELDINALRKESGN